MALFTFQLSNTQWAQLMQRFDSATAQLRRIAVVLELFRDRELTPVKLQLKINGGTTMADVQEGLLIGADEAEFNAEGDQVPAADPSKLSYAVDDATIAQVLTTADDPTIPVGKAKIMGLKVGTVNVTCTDNALTPPLVSDPIPLNVTLDPVAKKIVVSLA